MIWKLQAELFPMVCKFKSCLTVSYRNMEKYQKRYGQMPLQMLCNSDVIMQSDGGPIYGLNI